MPWKDTQSSRLRRVFLEGFSAMDIAEPLVSFDADADALSVRHIMEKKDFDLVGVRRDGLVCSYVRREDLTGGRCADHIRAFTPDDDLVPDTANLLDVVRSLAINEQCFVTILDRVGAIVTLSDLEKPPMRMFLFGMITIIEMSFTEILRRRYPDNRWQELLSESRLAKAKILQKERARRGEQVPLIDCLQFGDKGWILTYDEELRKALGQGSRKEARRAVKEFERLRNNLAHTQEIIPTGWQQIILTCSRWEDNMEHFISQTPPIEEDAERQEALDAIEEEMRTRSEGWWSRLVAAIPELKELDNTPQSPVYHAEGDVGVHTRMAIEACSPDCDPDLRWVALLHDAGKAMSTRIDDDGRITAHGHDRVSADLAERILCRLGMSEARRHRIVWAVRLHMFHLSWQLTPASRLSKRQQNYLTHPDFPLLLEFLKIDSLASRGKTTKMDAYDFYKEQWEKEAGV